MYFTKIIFVVPKSHKYFHRSSVVPPCKAAVKVLNNLSTQHSKHCFWHLAVNLSILFSKQVLLLKHRSGVRGLQKSMTDVPLEHHEECACVCKDDSDWPPTCVIAANGSIRDVRNEPLPLSLSHPLPLEANKILLLSWCPFTNWMKQNRLESNKSSKWIWLLWNTNRVLWVHFRKAKKNHWSRSGPLPMSSEDYFLPFFWDKNICAISSCGLF